MNLTNGSLDQLSRSLYYAPIPALIIGHDNLVADYNLALEAVVGRDLNGQRYLPLSQLSRRLTPQIRDGTLFPDDANSRTDCEFQSQDLGGVRLLGKAFSCHEPGSGEPAGRILLWEVGAGKGNDHFYQRYREKLDHQLIWDTYAWSYDRILPLMPYYQEVLERHVEVLSRTGDGPVTDLGAGTGNLAVRLLAAGRYVTAVDNSRAMLDKLKSKPPLINESGRRLTVLEAQAQFLPMIKDNSQAGVSLQLALFDMRFPQLGLATAIRILRPGGSIVVTDLKRTFQLAPLLEECERRLHTIGRYDELAEDLERVVRSNQGLAPGSRSAFRIEDVFEHLSQQGFQELSFRDSHFGQCATVVARKPA